MEIKKLLLFCALLLSGSLQAEVPQTFVVTITSPANGSVIASSNGVGTNMTIFETFVVNTNSLIVTNGRVGIGVVPTNVLYGLQIRNTNGVNIGGGLLIDNDYDSDMRGGITMMAGKTTQGRRYIYFQDISNTAGILLGANRANDFILYNGFGHKLVAGAGANGNTELNATGAGAVEFNVGSSVGGGTGGVVMYDGNTNSAARQYSFDASGGIAWIGLPMQAKSIDNNKTTEMSTTPNSGFIKSTDSLIFVTDSKEVMQITNQLVSITSLTVANKVLQLNGQQQIGVTGAHGNDYGLTIGSGSFDGSDGYISFKVGGGATEYGRINMDENGFLKISAPLSAVSLQPAGGNVGIGTLTPSSSLDVIGQVRADSAIFTNGMTTAYGTFYKSNSLALPTAAQIGVGGYFVTTSNGVLVALYSINGTTTVMKILAP